MARLEAALFAAREPLSLRQLVKLADLADVNEVRQLVGRLNAALERTHGAFRIEELAGGLRLLTRSALQPWLTGVARRAPPWALSPVLLETLTIIAYRQPITRAAVEAIRGVGVAEVIHQLLNLGLVRIVGAEETLGRPYLYGTTKQFLDAFGLRSLGELPMAEWLAPAPTEAPPPVDRDETDDEAVDALEMELEQE